MIKLDATRNKLNKRQYYGLQRKISNIHESFMSDVKNNSFGTGWFNFEQNVDVVDQMQTKINELKNEGVEHLLVIGIGGSFLGSSSAIDFINGKYDPKKNVHFAGVNLSSSHINQIKETLSDKKYAICVISKSGTTIEPAIIFRYFKDDLKQRYGEDYNKYVISITSENSGKLVEISKLRNYTSFYIDDNTGGRFSALTPAGTFPMLWAGIDVKALMSGAAKAKKELTASSKLDENIAYKYAAIRYALNRPRLAIHRTNGLGITLKTTKQYDMEIMTTYDSDLQQLTNWWVQLFGESEGKFNRGIYPTKAFNTTDLHSLGQAIQGGKKIFFETTLWIEEQFNKELLIPETSDDLDGLNYLRGVSIQQINKLAFESVYKAHSEDANTPNIVLFAEKKNEETFGYLLFFWWMSVVMSAKLNKMDPFNQPEVEIYKNNLKKELEKYK